ncbi:MAG: Protein phosphatase 2C 1 [Trizodia sp. TS-e1964]|nr:MAG: Protein phosphatase 2C 1 [Trizodia sp. TS-e1964]
MFGSSSSSLKEEEAPLKPSPSSATTEPATKETEKRSTSIGGEERPLVENDSAGGEKKRRSNTATQKASSLLASAKNTFQFSGSPSGTSSSSSLESVQNSLQKTGKADAALAVPQGSLNNSAGESKPGPRSTFRVGVAEDKNKRCRRTMEDTHSYLYNFLSTPAPFVGSETSLPSLSTADESLTPTDSHSSVVATAAEVIETDNGYFAIFDGHAGTFAADWCGKKLHVILEETIRKNPNTPIPELLDQTFTSVDQQLEKLPVKNSGCTAITAVLRWEDRIPSQSVTGSTAIAPATVAALKAVTEHSAEASSSLSPPEVSHSSGGTGLTSPATQAKIQESASRQRVLYTANVGDARIVLCRNGKALRLSYDHKGSDENEGKRVANAGGLILNNRVNGVLAVTRALGDAYMKDLVTGHPYTTETVIQPEIDEFLILACDGLWDVCSDQEAVDLIRNTQDPQVASDMLVRHALARFSTDNLSCMVVRFDQQTVLKAVERKTEPIGVEGDPPSKKGGVSEADAIVMEAKANVEAGKTLDQPNRVLEQVAAANAKAEATPKQASKSSDPKPPKKD